MSTYTNRATVSLLNMTREMYRKNIEIGRITKTAALLLMSGLNKQDLDQTIVKRCIESQNADGGFIGNTDTIWNIKLLEYFPEFQPNRDAAVQWLLNGNGNTPGFGRNKRDIHRIPVTGLALYLIPETRNIPTMDWLAKLWNCEINSLTYKAAYTLMAMQQCGILEKHEGLFRQTIEWLLSQQQVNGGFSPWFDHPVGENVYCTAIAMLGIMSDRSCLHHHEIAQACQFLYRTQKRSGIWPYHEIEDGTSWGLYALTQAEIYLENNT